MAGGKASFEIQAMRDNRWVAEGLRDTEESAKQAAKQLFGKGACTGVRVVKNWQRMDGNVTETVVYTETREAAAPKVTASPIEQAPVCKTLGDYYRGSSRSVINRVLSKYIDKVILTPSEIMHSYSALKKVQEVDTLFPGAVDRVASIQAKALGEDVKIRRDELYRVVAQLSDKARRAAQNKDLPVLKGDDLDGLIAQVSQAVPADEAEFNIRVALCKQLAQTRSWLGKLERLAALAKPSKRAEALRVIDELVADLIGVPAALQDILGQHRNLAKALCAMIDLYEGAGTVEKSDAAEQMAVLAPLMAEGKLEEARTSLMERVQRQLAGGQPLSRNEPTQEAEAFREVATRLYRNPKQVLGGPATAAALVQRYVFMGEAGGKAGLRMGVGGVASALGDPLLSTIFLTDLAASELGEDLKDTIAEVLRNLLLEEDIKSLAPNATNAPDILRAVKRIFDALAGDNALPSEMRQDLLDGLDTLLANYIRREGIIEKLDDPSAKLRDRAIRLIDFCSAGLLPDGKALRTARDRVVNLLRQPDFTQRFIAGLASPTAAEKELREFHARLVRGGFR
jgi:hypothetical protein